MSTPAEDLLSLLGEIRPLMEGLSTQTQVVASNNSAIATCMENVARAEAKIEELRAQIWEVGERLNSIINPPQ